MLSHVQQGIGQSYGSPSAFEMTYLTEPSGCVPDEFIGDDLLASIKEKYYWLFDAVRNQLEGEFGRDRMLLVHVDPSYEDATHALLTLEDERVLLAYDAKAWNLWWPNREELANELREWHRIARGRYRSVMGRYVETPGNRIYMVDFEHTSGEFGQPFHHVFEAVDDKDLQRQVQKYLKGYYDGGSRREGNSWFYLDDQVTVKLDGWREITEPMQVLQELKV